VSPIPDAKLKLGRALLAGGVLTKELVQRELERSGKGGSKLGRALVACNYPGEEAVLAPLVQNIRIPNIPVARLDLPAETLQEVSVEHARQHKIIPLDRIGDILVVVTPDIGNANAFASLRKATGCTIAPIRCALAGFDEAIDRLYANLTPRPSQGGTSTTTPAAGVSKTKTPESIRPPVAPAETKKHEPYDPELYKAIPATPAEATRTVPVNGAAYYNLTSMWEQRFTTSGPIRAEETPQ